MRRSNAILLSAAGYLVFGTLSLLMPMPTGQANLIWLPAGMALAALLMLGNRAWPGIVLGSILFQILIRKLDGGVWNVASLILGIGFSLGAGLQALAGAWLIRRYIGNPGPLDTARDIVRFWALGGLLACLVNPIWSLSQLVLSGRLPPDTIADNFLAWWLGDVLGVLLMTPLLLILGAEPREIWRARRLTLGVPLASIMVLALTMFALVGEQEDERLAATLQARARQAHDALTRHIEARIQGMVAVAGWLESQQSVDAQLADALARRVLNADAGAQILQWAPRLSGPGQDASPGAASQDSAFPVRMVVPLAGNEALLGRDLAGLPELLPAMGAARDSGEPVLAPVLAGAGEAEQGKGPHTLWIVVPVYQSLVPLRTLDERRQALRGILASALPMDALVASALADLGQASMAIEIVDQTSAGPGQVLYARASTGAPAEPLRGMVSLPLAGRQWRVTLLPTAAALQAARSWHVLAILVVGLLAATLLGAHLLLVTGQTARTEARAARQASELDEVQAQLRQTELMHRLAQSNLVAIEVCDPDGGVHEANDAFLQMLGYTREDLQAGRIRWNQMTPPEWAEADRIAVENSKDRDVIPAWEKEFWRKDGSRVPVMLGVARLPGDDNRFVAFIADLSKVKAAEAALRRKTTELERYKVIVNSTPIAIYTKEYTEERQGVYVLTNPICTQVGGTDHDLVGLTDYDLFAPDIAAALQARDREVLQRGEPVIGEERVIDARTGKVVYLLSTKVPLLDDGGKPFAIAGFSQVVTEQRELTARLAALVNAIPDIMFRFDAEGVCIDFKNSRNLILAMPPEETLGRRLDDLSLPDEFRRLSMVALREAIRTGEIQEIEYSLTTPVGERFYEARLVKSSDDEVVALVRDITESRQARIALEAMNAKLRVANTELKEFAYVASHDLQEPLRTVISYVELLESRYGDAFDDKGRKWLQFIVSGTQRMRALIGDLLAYSRAGRTGRIEQVETRGLLDEVLGDIRAAIEAADADIEIGALPTILANPTELRQIFQNLVSNALKFRRPDVRPRVVISAEPGLRSWTFTVADNGIGIEPEYHDRIFLVFQRLHERERYPGTGIGLSLVKKIVERRGGLVTVRSTPGRGSEFRFTLPSTQHDEDAADAELAS